MSENPGKPVLSKETETPNARRQVQVKREQLPIHCPMPGSSLWNSHPRVYIPLHESGNGKALCSYCGTLYTLAD